MVTLHEVITFLVSMQISISSLQTHNVNRCGRSRHLARKLSLRRKRSSPNVFEMAATETITSIILIKLIRVSLGTVRHPRRFKIVVIDIQITLKQMLRDFIGIRVNRAKKSGMVNITSSVNSRERSGINTILHELNPLFTINVTMRDIKSKNVYSSNLNFFSDKLVLTSVTPASSAPVLQTPKATSSTLYFDSLTVNAGNGGFLHCIQMDTSVNAANQVVSVGADIAFDADPKFFACLVRFESSSVPTTLPTAYDVYPLDGRHDGGYYTVKDCVTIDVLPRTPGNNVYVGFMVWSNFTATKCRGLVSLNQVIKEIICLQPLK